MGFDAYYMPLVFVKRSAQGDPQAKPGGTKPIDGVIDRQYSFFGHLLGANFTLRF